jgi:hypothetical protein
MAMDRVWRFSPPPSLKEGSKLEPFFYKKWQTPTFAIGRNNPLQELGGPAVTSKNYAD